MTARPAISDEQRRARIGRRHAIAPGTQVDTLADAARAMVALHGTDVTSMYLQARARMVQSSPESIGRAMYDVPTVLRVLAMRRTLFLTPLEDVATLHAAASLDIGRRERARTLAMFSAGGIGPDTAGLFDELERIGLAAVRERGEASTAELTALDDRLGQRITLAQGKSYAASMSVSQKVFFHLALDGHIGRGRPRGTWIGSQVRWSPIERWLPEGIPSMATDIARARLVGQWLRVFGPGTRDDLRWWTGWTVAAIRAALDANTAVEVDLDDGQIGYLMPDDLDPDPTPGPWIALLPALDATTMGWQARDWYLGPHRPVVFDSNGNAGPTIWADGHIVGGWGQRASGGIATRSFVDIGSEAAAAVEAEADRIGQWVGATSIRSSFPTPIDIELRAG